MRKHAAQAASIALPFATFAAAQIITPGYDLAGHTTTLMVALIVGFAGLFAVTLNMKDDARKRSGWLLAAGWTTAVAIAIVTMMETVILKPEGVDGRQWLPCMALAAIAIVTSCDREGDVPDRFMLIRSAAVTSLMTGVLLGLALMIGAAAGRLSGEDGKTLLITLGFAALLYGTVVQAQRADEPGRSRLGVATVAMLFLIVVTSIGTYAWTPHISPDALGREMFG